MKYHLVSLLHMEYDLVILLYRGYNPSITELASTLYYLSCSCARSPLTGVSADLTSGDYRSMHAHFYIQYLETPHPIMVSNALGLVIPVLCLPARGVHSQSESLVSTVWDPG